MQSNFSLFYIVNFAVGTVDKIIKKKEDGEADEVDVSIAARASSESEHSMEIAHSDSGRIEHYSAPDLDIKNEEKFRNDNVVEDNAIVDNFQLDPLAEQVLCAIVSLK